MAGPKYITGQELGLELCEAAGIDPDMVQRITIDCGLDDLVRVTIKGLAHANTKDVMAHYVIVKRDEPLPPPKIGDVYYKTLRSG